MINKQKCQYKYKSGKVCGVLNCEIKHQKTDTLSNKILHNKKALIEALEKSLGIVTTACKTVGLDRSTFYKYVNEDADFAQAVKDIDNVALDFAESQLHKQIQTGIPSSTIFYLKTKGKNRGYVERIEQTGKDGGAIETVVITPKTDKN